jgi:hypothetical protein
MKSVVRPELSTAAAGPSQAPTAAVDNSAPLSNHPKSTYKSGKAVQTTGTTSKRSRNLGLNQDKAKTAPKVFLDYQSFALFGTIN